MKSTVIGYFAVLALSGLVSLSVLGASMLQRNDNRGIPVLALVVGGLLLTFVQGVLLGRKSKAGCAVGSPGAIARESTTTTVVASEDFAHSPSAVWAVIRPAESSLSLEDGVYHALSVPAIPDGPGELQCFFYRNGYVGVLEVVEEVPEQLAVTRPRVPVGPDMLTRYRLEGTGGGSRLTIESDLEVSGDFSLEGEEYRRYWGSYLRRVNALLDQQAGGPGEAGAATRM
ncbi:hypothetical protein StoSoilB3_10690 [Arthrobacter sp. StoSoilB3]|uniref:hypothetical protein n=1 Tax=Paenarthrobacter nicotinovorans TaxID=29320 RepID=UPI001668FD76|nr:hypothetical protein [Paenarthrobacter nicotinovorans]MBP2393551.1 hypothetical protein [Paenarthrobacter nicotinovorans]UKF00196.1 hypothetical protein LU808_05150 [Paenarthrobacter nicotinovorans]UKF04978.1 hypothetical protein JMY29_05175 [Paenarthrobacter nicotinovorans]BCW39534.1 hypothetical protein StoSoilB3_10690 [Arthrobacter sp. StoSoilB3]